jgi:hypothetical protein
MLSLGRACGARHPALVDPDRIEVVSERYASAPLRAVFGYESGWPLISAGRRAEIEALIGAPAPPAPPGPAAGEQAGFPGAGDPSRRHQDLRGLGERASEGGLSGPLYVLLAVPEPSSWLILRICLSNTIDGA